MSEWTTEVPIENNIYWISVSPERRLTKSGVQFPPVCRCSLVDSGDDRSVQFVRAKFRLTLDLFIGAKWKRVDPDPPDPFAEQPRKNSRDSDFP